MYAFDSVHRIEYSNEKLVPVKQIIKSLSGFDRLIHELPPILNALNPGGTILSAELYVQEVASGSLLEDLIVRFFFQDEDGFNAWIDALRKKTGMENAKVAKVFVGSAISIAVAYGIYCAVRSDQAAPASALSTITGNQNVVINFVADTLQADPVVIRDAVQAAIKDKKALAQGAVDVVKAAKLDNSATITIDGNEQTVITAETVQATPQNYEAPKPDQIVKEYSRALVQIRATDRDNASAGWYCIVPDIVDRRLRLVLDPSVDREQISREISVMASIAVISKYNASSRQYKESEVLIRTWERIK